MSANAALAMDALAMAGLFGILFGVMLLPSQRGSARQARPQGAATNTRALKMARVANQRLGRARYEEARWAAGEIPWTSAEREALGINDTDRWIAQTDRELRR